MAYMDGKVFGQNSLTITGCGETDLFTCKNCKFGKQL